MQMWRTPPSGGLICFVFIFLGIFLTFLKRSFSLPSLLPPIWCFCSSHLVFVFVVWCSVLSAQCSVLMFGGRCSSLEFGVRRSLLVLKVRCPYSCVWVLCSCARVRFPSFGLWDWAQCSLLSVIFPSSYEILRFWLAFVFVVDLKSAPL